jgi:hypothetical protein
MKVRDGISWCLCSGRVVLLDLAADRYFRMAKDLEPALIAFASGERGPMGEPEQLRLELMGLLEEGTAAVLPPAGTGLAAPARDLLDESVDGTGLAAAAGALLAQWRTKRALRRHGVAGLIRRIKLREPALPSPDPVGRAAAIADAFDRSALIWRKTDRCLPRALALWSRCRADGIAATLVLGVRLDPFSAHSWVQLGEAVLVGDFEQARLHVPILVLP